MSVAINDVVDHLAGIVPGSHLDRLRDLRSQARTQTQQSYLALFEPQSPVSDGFPVQERLLVAVFVAELHRQPEIASFYAALLSNRQEAEPLRKAIRTEAHRAGTHGPYGYYPDGPLSRENTTGKVYHPEPSIRDLLGKRLAAALAHAHLLVFRPRDAKPVALQALLDAGWSATDIVTLSQLVAFLTYQIRVVTGLRTLAQTSATLAA